MDGTAIGFHSTALATGRAVAATVGSGLATAAVAVDGLLGLPVFAFAFTDDVWALVAGATGGVRAADCVCGFLPRLGLVGAGSAGNDMETGKGKDEVKGTGEQKCARGVCRGGGVALNLTCPPKPV